MREPRKDRCVYEATPPMCRTHGGRDSHVCLVVLGQEIVKTEQAQRAGDPPDIRRAPREKIIQIQPWRDQLLGQ